MKVVNQSQTQKINPQPNKGMEVFLTQSPSHQTKEEKMKIQQTNTKFSNPQPYPSPSTGSDQKTNPQPYPSPSTGSDQKTNPQPYPNNQIEEFEEMIKEIEQKLLKNVKHRELELTAFNNLIYTKKLMFKVLFIRGKIYTLVSDPQTNRVAIVRITPPKWGGTSLRVLISQCVSSWCRVIEKDTKKGRILSYEVIGGTLEVDNIDDIF